MKTKNKILALVEIAIVLCSVFLVALPAIAADQNQEAQKVSANTITTTADRPTYEHTDLDVFGNANEDDTIDMRDTTYIKLLIFGKKPKTDLADANYDGKVSMLDVGQTKLIILGKEKELIFIDIFGEAVTVTKPIKHLVGLGRETTRVTRTVGARDILVGVGHDFFQRNPAFFPEISKLPLVGGYGVDKCDFEMILSLEPDAVTTNLEGKWALIGGLEDKRMFEEKLPGIPIISLNMRNSDVLVENVRTYGYILDREDEAKEFINWYEKTYNEIEALTKDIPEDKKPHVYFGYKVNQMTCPGHRGGQALNLAGGRNIADDIIGPDHPQYNTMSLEVDLEWVVEQNPDIILYWGGYAGPSGYETDDPSVMAAERKDITDNPALANLDAVKKGHVYAVEGRCLFGGSLNLLLGSAYLAKLFHPDIDIDPQAIHQEYVDKFCYIDFNVREHGVFVYPPPEEWTPWRAQR